MAPTIAPSPQWLSDWRTGRLDAAGALARFDGLAALDPEAMIGRWAGSGLPTGHPLDGVLEALGWWGKAFESADRVHPLLFGARRVAIDPARLPVGLALRCPGLARSGLARRGFDMLRPALRTGRPAARLRRVAFRGKASAAMIYDRRPITDHFRAIDPDRALGLMEMRGMTAPFFFLLLRDDAARGA